MHPPPSPAWANFSIMIECTSIPESCRCHSVCTLWLGLPGVQEWLAMGVEQWRRGGGEDDCALCVVCTVQYYVNVHYASCKLHIHIVWIASFVKRTLLKRKRKFSKNVRKFRRDRVQSHIWGNEQIFRHIWLCALLLLHFLIYEKKCIFFVYSDGIVRVRIDSLESISGLLKV